MDLEHVGKSGFHYNHVCLHIDTFQTAQSWRRYPRMWNSMLCYGIHGYILSWYTVCNFSDEWNMNHFGWVYFGFWGSLASMLTFMHIMNSKPKKRVWRMQGVSPFLFPFGDCIQLSILPVPVRATLTGLFGLAPAGLLVSSTTWQSRPSGFIVHTTHRSFLHH